MGNRFVWIGKEGWDLRPLILSVAIVGGAGFALKTALGTVTWEGMVTVGIAASAAVAIQVAWNIGRVLNRTREEHARERESFDHIVETLPVGVCTFRHGGLVSGNDAFNELIGDTVSADSRTQEARSAGPGLAFERALHPLDKVRVLNALRESEEARIPFEETFRISPRAGDERHIEGKGVPILDDDGGVQRMLAYFLDVTDTVRAEAEVRDKQESLEGANRLLRETLMDLEANFQAMVQAFVKVVEAKDPYTAGHSERVMAYAMWMGEAMGLRPDDLRTLRMGCLVHDVGKIGVPDSILTKPGALSSVEFAAIRQHPGAGVRIIEHIPLFHDCIPIVRHHHERLDGTGYPDRLKGDEISTLVRIAAVADCFDAMTSTRAYRNGMDVERAMRELHRDAERGALDPEIVTTFGEIIRREGVLWTPMSRAA